MDDVIVQKKLNQLTKIANELSDELLQRYGPDGKLFYEADGQFCFMSGDEPDGNNLQRQEFVVLISKGVCRMDCGAW